MKSGWAQGVWGTEVPSGVQVRSPGGGLRALPPEARYIQTVCSCRMLFYARLLPSPFSISLRSHKLRQCKRKHNFSIPLYCICECFTITWLCHVGGLIRLGGSAIPGGPKKRNPGFDFVITSANVHRF